MVDAGDAADEDAGRAEDRGGKPVPIGSDERVAIFLSETDVQCHRLDLLRVLRKRSVGQVEQRARREHDRPAEVSHRGGASKLRVCGELYRMVRDRHGDGSDVDRGRPQHAAEGEETFFAVCRALRSGHNRMGEKRKIRGGGVRKNAGRGGGGGVRIGAGVRERLDHHPHGLLLERVRGFAFHIIGVLQKALGEGVQHDDRRPDAFLWRRLHEPAPGD